MKTEQNYSLLSHVQQWGFIILRIILGWYFLYEGVVKLMNPDWSVENYLMNSRLLSDVFQWMVSQPKVLEIVNFLNVWGLILIGLALFLGIFARTAVYAGILILFFYYISYLPLDKFTYGIPTEGSYLLFDKTFIILITLVILALFPSTLKIGLCSLLKKIKFRVRVPFTKFKQKPESNSTSAENSKNRREILKDLVFLPFMGGFIYTFLSNRKFTSQMGPDAITGSTITLNTQPLRELEGKMPQGKFGNKSMSRLISGNNLIGGWAHARDLIYASQLFKAYNTEKKVFETLQLSERAGINTMNLISNQLPLINRYKKLFGSNLQTMVQVGAGYGATEKEICEDIDRSIDLGADFIQIWGVASDILALNNKIDELGKCVDYGKRQGYPTGIGAHDINTFLAFDQVGVEPDFYFKTLHHDNYRSAIPREDRVPFEVVAGAKPNRNSYYDNMWCLFPEQTIEYIQKVKKPVIAYKVLAAGAIRPEEGFQYAFDNGADFICVGMFDFQIVEDANLAIRSIEKASNRQRPWYG